MKMKTQSQTFARQAQADLLTLPDMDLFRMVHLWVTGSSSAASAQVYSALGYTAEEKQPDPLSQEPLLLHEPSEDQHGGQQWIAPTPQQMREKLMGMDVKLFMQHVLPLAYQSLHGTYPEWDEGATFNAHLANHLRQRSAKR